MHMPHMYISMCVHTYMHACMAHAHARIQVRLDLLHAYRYDWTFCTHTVRLDLLHAYRYDWTFCDFIRNYKKPEYRNMLYVVSPLSERGVSLRNHLSLPEILRCEEIYSSVYEARPWTSDHDHDHDHDPKPQAEPEPSR